MPRPRYACPAAVARAKSPRMLAGFSISCASRPAASSGSSISAQAPATWTAATPEAACGLPGDGPQLVVTDKAIFDFDNPDHEMQLTHLHPGVTLEEVRASIGWELRLAVSVGETSAPTENELNIIRAELASSTLQG